MRPFTTAQARERGLTSRQLQSRKWRQVVRGVWVAADVADSRELRLLALGLVLPPRAVVWGPTAAWLWGASVLSSEDGVRLPASHATRRGTGHCRRTDTPAPAGDGAADDVC